MRGEPLALLGGDGLGGEDHDWDLRRGRIGLQPLHDFESVGPGHQQVEDDEVGLLGSRRLDPLRPRQRRHHREALLAEHRFDELDGHRVVVDGEHLERSVTDRGRDEGAQGGEEVVAVHRFDQVVGGPQREAPPALVEHRDDDHWDSR